MTEASMLREDILQRINDAMDAIMRLDGKSPNYHKLKAEMSTKCLRNIELLCGGS